MILGSIIEQVSAIVSIITPPILLFWFYYTRKQNFYNEFLGIYAGYIDSEQVDGRARISSGLIMSIKDISSDGFFRGDFDYRKNLSTNYDDQMLHDGMYTFYGKINYRIFFPKARHLLKVEENRIYKGKLTIVMRLDFQIETQSIESFSQEEYLFEYYREIRAIKFTLLHPSKNQTNNIPEKFLLHKSLGLSFEPYKNVKQSIFRGFTRTDN